MKKTELRFPDASVFFATVFYHAAGQVVLVGKVAPQRQPGGVVSMRLPLLK